MLRGVFKLRTAMLLVAAAALALAAKSHFVDRPANRRKAEFYRKRAEDHASSIRFAELLNLFGGPPDPTRVEELRRRRSLEQHYRAAALDPTAPTRVMDEESQFLRWTMAAMADRRRKAVRELEELKEIRRSARGSRPDP